MGKVQNIKSERVRTLSFALFFWLLIYSFRANLRINDKNGHPIIISCPTLPENLRRGVMDHLQLIYPHLFKRTDTTNTEGPNIYDALHFTWYNRFCEKVMSTQSSLFKLLIHTIRERNPHLGYILATLFGQNRTGLFLYPERLQKHQKSLPTMLQSISSSKLPWKRCLTGFVIRFVWSSVLCFT